MPSSAVVLAIETSCDETAVAILRGTGDLLASEVSSQIALHRPHGGVVPEVASRSHLELIRPLIITALQRAGITLPEISLFAATSGPGLASALLVGSSVAKGLAIGLQKPFLAVNHLEGHLLSPFFGLQEPPPRCVGLIVSGGHTSLVEMRGVGDYSLLGHTRDDAAGEAFDKVGKLLGLPYPGGPEVDRVSVEGNPEAFDFPRSMLNREDLDFSFSGLKTAVRYLLPRLTAGDTADVCASFQEAVVDVLVGKSLKALEKTGCNILAVSGGVSCNRRLREKLSVACESHGIRLYLAEPRLSTDNAAMIAFAAALRFRTGASTPVETDIDPNLALV